MGYYGYPRYVPVAEKKATAEKKLKQLKKKNPKIQPIQIEGKAIAKSWWGKSWNKNLECYADYTNRIGRGRSYLRHGAVLDLQIKPGKITALVQGSTSKPYKVEIGINKLSQDRWKKIKKICENKIESLSELLEGKFPKNLGEIFMEKNKGLFPSPKEINFNCSCPDIASMCKHVAATLYGIGARLDKDTSLFFTLRKVNMDELIKLAVKSKTKKLLEKTDSKSSKVIDDSDLESIFGIDMVSSVEPATIKLPKATVFKKAKISKKSKSSKTDNASIKKQTAKTTSPKHTSYGKTISIQQNTNLNKKQPYDIIVGIIRRRTINGINVKGIKEKTGFDEQQIRNCVYKAKRNGLIKIQNRGVYLKS